MLTQLVAWRHQAITWTNVDLSSVRSCGIYLRTISFSHEMLSIFILDTSLKITNSSYCCIIHRPMSWLNPSDFFAHSTVAVLCAKFQKDSLNTSDNTVQLFDQPNILHNNQWLMTQTMIPVVSTLQSGSVMLSSTTSNWATSAANGKAVLLLQMRGLHEYQLGKNNQDIYSTI